MGSGRGSFDVCTPARTAPTGRPVPPRTASAAASRRSASLPPTRPETPAEAAALWRTQDLWAEERPFAEVLAPASPAATPLGERLPRPGARGLWGGRPGDAPWHPHVPEAAAATGGRPVQFFAGYPDFSPWAVFACSFDGLTSTHADFARADAVLRAAWQLPTLAATRAWRREQAYTWHHHEDARTLLLVPRAVHGNVAHTGGAARARRGAVDPALAFVEGWQAASVSADGPPTGPGAVPGRVDVGVAGLPRRHSVEREGLDDARPAPHVAALAGPTGHAAEARPAAAAGEPIAAGLHGAAEPPAGLSARRPARVAPPSAPPPRP